MTPSAAKKNRKAPSAIAVAAWLLLLIAAARVLALVLASPGVAYANQYDMARSSACIGWWPVAAEGSDRTAAHRPAPRLTYAPGMRSAEVCYPSTTVLLAYIALAIDRGLDHAQPGIERHFDLRTLGLLQASLFVGLLLCFDRRLRRHPVARLSHGLVGALVLADPMNTLYLSTLYTEFAALLSAYASVAILVDAALRRRLSWPMGIALALALSALGFSRMQHLLLPLALALLLLAVCAVQRCGLRRALPALAMAIAIPYAQSAGTADQAGIHAANRSNALFGALLPASADPARLLARLGLGQPCLELVHTTWYLPRGHDARQECPQAYELGQGALLTAFAGEPRTLAVAAGRLVTQSMAWRLPYLGEVAGADYAKVDPGPVHLRASVADLLARAGFELHATLWIGTLVLGIGALSLCWRRGRSDERLATAAILAATALIAASAFATTLFGDGYSEVARHLHLGANAVLSALCVVVVAAVRALSAGPATDPALTVVCTGGTLFAVLAALLWLRLPLAVGVLAQPSDDRWSTDGWTISGWAIDPAGVSAAYVQAGDGHREPLQTSAAPRITAMFPQRAAIGAVRLHGTIAARELAARPAPWRIVVVNTRSVESVIDWRWPRRTHEP